MTQTALQPRRCKDAKELKESLTAWSLKVPEYEHQFKVIDEAQKTFVVRKMMPKDIRREFLKGTEEVQRDDGEVGDHHQLNGGR